jgi:hypothetical protein
MNAQKITNTAMEGLIVMRLIHPLPDKQTENMPIQFLPDFSLIITNMEYCDSQEISKTLILNKPFEIGGITAKFMVEVWGLENGKRKRLQETWYFNQRPPKCTPQEFINGFFDRADETTMEEAKKRQAERPERFYKSEIQTASPTFVDPWENARIATLALLKEEYPLLASALETGKSTPETSRAFIADCVRLTGRIDADVNLNDPKFVAQLSEAYQAHNRRNVRKSKVNSVDWFLANPRSWSKLYNLTMAEIATRVFDETKIKLSPGAIERRIGRLKLITPRKRGKPAKKVIPTD